MTPTEILDAHRHTKRPQPCVVCGHMGYYLHGDRGFMCSTHLLDICNVGELLFKWSDYEYVWKRGADQCIS